MPKMKALEVSVMNRTQKIIVAATFSLLVLSYILTDLYQEAHSIIIFKYGLRVTLLACALVFLKKEREPIFLVLALLFTLFSDYYFSLSLTFASPPANRELLGVLGFIMAYPMLMLAFGRQFRFQRRDLLVVAPFVLTYLIILYFLLPYASGMLMYAAIALGVVLCCFAVVMVSALYRGVYTRRPALFIALGAIILFISDMVVAFSIFYPPLKGFILWKEQVIWLTYVPGWVLFLLAVADDQLLAAKA